MSPIFLTFFWLLIAVIVLRFIVVLLQRPIYKSYWHSQNKIRDKNASFELLAIGDSIVQGIGASRPSRSLVGLIADRIGVQTGKTVNTTNISKTGGTTRVVTNLLHERELIERADMIVIAVSANDIVKRTSLKQYEQDMRAFLQLLPPEKTLMADVPLLRRRDGYERVFRQLTEQYGIEPVSFDHSMASAGHYLRYVAGDFFHPNDKGYKELWFTSFKPRIDALLKELKL